MSLARDALSSGDIVTAESYLQYAEHYNRIVMAAQSQAAPQNMSQPGDQSNGGGGRPRHDPLSGGGENAELETADGGTGSQDRERHMGDREHHGGRGRGRQGDNRSEGVQDANTSEGVQDANGAAEPAEPAEAQASDESETAPDQVS